MKQHTKYKFNNVIKKCIFLDSLVKGAHTFQFFINGFTPQVLM